MAILPNKTYKRDKDFDIKLVLPFCVAVGIVFKILGASFISQQILIPSFGMVILFVFLCLKKSVLNQGKRCIEQYFIFMKFMVVKIKERIMRFYV